MHRGALAERNDSSRSARGGQRAARAGGGRRQAFLGTASASGGSPDSARRPPPAPRRPPFAPEPDVTTRRVFLLSPARCDGERAKLLTDPDARSPLATQL